MTEKKRGDYRCYECGNNSLDTPMLFYVEQNLCMFPRAICFPCAVDLGEREKKKRKHELREKCDDSIESNRDL